MAVEAAIAGDPELAKEYSDLSAVARVLRAEKADPTVTGFAETIAAIRAGAPRTAEAKANRPWVLIGQFAVAASIAGLFFMSAFWNVRPPGADLAAEEGSKEMATSAAPATEMAKRASTTDNFASRDADSITSSPAMTSKSVASGDASVPISGGYSDPLLGPVLPPGSRPAAGSTESRAPGSGERPLMAISGGPSEPDAAGGQPSRPITGLAGNIPNEVFPLEVEPLPSAAGNGAFSAGGVGAVPGSLAAMEATVRSLVTVAKGTISGTSRTPLGSRITITVDEASADSLTKNIESTLGDAVSIEPAKAESILSNRLATALPKSAEKLKADALEPELTQAQLEKRLADQQAKREELLKDFYEDAKPVKSLDTEILETKTQIERRKRAEKVNKISYIVILKPNKQ